MCRFHITWEESVKILVVYFFSYCLAVGKDYNKYLPDDQKHPDLNMTIFPILKNYHLKGVKATEEEFPWVARIIHSRTNIYPHMCTAVCVGERLFLTSGRCTLGLKVLYTRVLYRNEFHIPVRAFALPSFETKQLYDDIAVIITEEFQPGGNEWPRLTIFNKSNRTDPRFAWFNDMHFERNRDDYYVVGYALEKTMQTSPFDRFNLYKLNILINMDLCPKLTRWEERTRDYYVPCYHTCTVVEHKHNEPACKRYLGVDGGAVVNVRSKTLIGISTWGAYTVAHNLPVGFAIPNSQQFHEQYACAVKIRDDKQPFVANRFQQICDETLRAGKQ